jgi:hypothetical protein
MAMPDRRARVLAGLDLAALTGVEIGPLDKPLVARADGSIIYVDHLETEALCQKYAADQHVATDKIVEIDAIWGDNTLAQALGPRAPVDYVIASHVIEHVPDLIAWLDELRQVIKLGGDLRLAIPDRRFSFDFLRRETDLADILDAYVHRARKPRPISILDFALNAAPVDPVAAWDGKLDPASLHTWHTANGALGLAQDAIENDTYHDVHCWVFTPASFVDLFRRAGALGLIRFACREFHDTGSYEIEFFAALTPCDDTSEVEASWASAAGKIKTRKRRSTSLLLHRSGKRLRAMVQQNIYMRRLVRSETARWARRLLLARAKPRRRGRT